MFSDLVTEDLDLQIGSVQRFVAAVVVAVRVDLNHQRETLDSFLRREVSAQAVDCDEDLQEILKTRGLGLLCVSENFNHIQNLFTLLF